MIVQLHPVLALETPLGRGDAILYEDDGYEVYWTVVLSDTCAIVQFKNNEVRAARNYTARRGISHAEMRKIIAPKEGA